MRKHIYASYRNYFNMFENNRTFYGREAVLYIKNARKDTL